MINSLLKALDILALFSSSEPRLSLATISERLGLPKSTAYNLLATLLSRGFVERVDNDYYALGTEVIVLAQSARVNVELRDRAAPLLRELAEAVRLSVYLTVREGDHVLYIYAIETPHRLLARTAVGDRVPFHCTANGKSILAHLSPAEQVASLTGSNLTSFTPNTITDPQALKQELDMTRERGYALDCQEHELGTYCVGAPIFDSGDRVVGACSVSGEDPQIVGERVADLAAKVKYTAQEISRRMGYVPSLPSQIVMRA